MIKICEKCNTKLTVKNGIKSFISDKIKCDECGSVYHQNKMTKFRSIYKALVIACGVTAYTSAFSNITILSLTIYLIIVSMLVFIYDVIPHKIHKYELKDN